MSARISARRSRSSTLRRRCRCAAARLLLDRRSSRRRSSSASAAARGSFTLDGVQPSGAAPAAHRVAGDDPPVARRASRARARRRHRRPPPGAATAAVAGVGGAVMIGGLARRAAAPASASARRCWRRRRRANRRAKRRGRCRAQPLGRPLADDVHPLGCRRTRALAAAQPSPPTPRFGAACRTGEVPAERAGGAAYEPRCGHGGAASDSCSSRAQPRRHEPLRRLVPRHHLREHRRRLGGGDAARPPRRRRRARVFLDPAKRSAWRSNAATYEPRACATHAAARAAAAASVSPWLAEERLEADAAAPSRGGRAVLASCARSMMRPRTNCAAPELRRRNCAWP